jgi:putative two-component system response regulator
MALGARKLGTGLAFAAGAAVAGAATVLATDRQGLPAGMAVAACSAAALGWAGWRLAVRNLRSDRDAMLAKLELVNRMALAAEYQDDGRSGHNRRIEAGTEAVARALGLGEARARTLGRAALLHDIGKIGVPHTILAKPGALSPDERAAVEGHALYGAHLLEGSQDPVIATGHVIALTHHERWDGRGYPNGLVGSAIPIEGRIVAVVDVFDALTSERPYKEAWTPEQARQAIVEGSGTQFDPEVVDAFLRVYPRLAANVAGAPPASFV